MVLLKARGGLIAGNMTRTADDITCYLLTLDTSGEFLGEYLLVAWNDHDMSDGMIEVRRPATDTGSYTSGKRTNRPSSAAVTLCAIAAIYILTGRL